MSLDPGQPVQLRSATYSSSFENVLMETVEYVQRPFHPFQNMQQSCMVQLQRQFKRNLNNAAPDATK